MSASTSMTTPRIGAVMLKAMLADGHELALLDVRDEGVFAKSHLFYAACMPLAQLELKLDALVPNRGVRVVLCDDDEVLATRAAARFERFGYPNLSILAGGVAAWRSAGHELFSGINVPSKAFGEYVEHRFETPSISAQELNSLIRSGTDMVILDSRPMDEFERMSIPGAMDCAGAELVYRVHEVAKRPETLVVVNCAGRTRSIIGAQSLLNAQIPNRVVALRNGTMGWNLAGLQTDHGKRIHAPAPGAPALEAARQEAAAVGRRFGVRSVAATTMASWRTDPERSLYVFDVRTPDEYRSGHLEGTRSAPGGQLVQSTDWYVGTRNARIVLIDSDGVRATMTASWLRQLGWADVFVWDAALSSDARLIAGEPPERVLGFDTLKPVATISAAALAASGKRVNIIDLATSLDYRRGHIAGAWFAVRSRFERSLGGLPPAESLVLTSSDGVLARFAAEEAAALLGVPVMVLEGGTAAWRSAGLPLSNGFERMLDSNDDVYYFPYDHDKQPERAMQDYLTWEVALVDQMKREGVAFPGF